MGGRRLLKGAHSETQRVYTVRVKRWFGGESLVYFVNIMSDQRMKEG